MRIPLLECRNDAERGRLLDISRRLRPVEPYAIGVFLLAGLVGVSTFGWLPLLPGLLGAAVFWTLQGRLERHRRPELVLAGSWLFAQVTLATAIALAGGPALFLLSVLIFPALLVSVVFPARAVPLIVVVTAALMLGMAFAFHAQAVLDTPFALAYPVVLLVAMTIPAATVRDLDVASRGTAVVDQLTGTLNRMALETRIPELSHEAAISGRPVALIVGDVDHFKSINDRHGHSAGDRVLKEVAYRLRETLGAFEPIYRFGGEEFVIPLAGVDAATAVGVAERLRESVKRAPIGDTGVTMSFGVAVTAPGEPFDFETTFARADGALYQAKHGGRNRVHSAAPGEAPAVAAGGDERVDRRANGAGVLAPVDRRGLRVAREHAGTGNWLIKGQLEREHLLDLNHRLRLSHHGAYVLAFACMAAAAPTYGWLTLVPPLIAAVAYNVVEHRLERLRRPEYALGITWLVTQVVNSLGFWFVDPAALFALPLMALMVIGSSAVFPRRAVPIGLTVVSLATVAAALHMDAQAVVNDPALVLLSLALLAASALIGAAVGRSAVDHRGAAVVDSLTGMLNRAALESRAAELAHQAELSGEQVALVVGDLDSFKSINDQHGHATGDAVLKEAAYHLRKHLRAFESAYRLGGDEFVVLLAGAGVDDAVGVAERLREAVHGAPIGDVPVAISFGVAASEPGGGFDLRSVFDMADAALYEAKQAGRNRVVARAGGSPQAVAA